MRIAFSLLLSVYLLCAVTFSLSGYPLQQQEGKSTDGQQPTSPPVVKQPLSFGLEDGTPVKLRTNRTISSSDAHVNDTLDFEVLDEVKVHDVVVIPRGGIAWGTVTEAQPKRRMGREGKLNINIDNVKLSSGEKIPLRAVKEAKGGGHQGAMTGAIVATAIVFFPAAPLFLLMHGKDITIPKGTEITAYINGDVPLDATKFSPTAAPSTTSTEPSLSSVDIKSTPDGAEITVDGKFMGNIPSSLRLAAGDHKVKLEKQGFSPWEKTLAVTSGENATINATLF
ncbi:MAG: PEGA domain-containing protein [Candidatus Acidiferrales bacterium]